jgi:hypothetical protein
MRPLGFYEMSFHDVRGGQYNGILEGVGGVSYRESGVINGGDRQTGIEFRTTSDFFSRYRLSNVICSSINFVNIETLMKLFL